MWAFQMHTQKYTIIGYGYMYMDLKYNNGLEQYTLCMSIITSVEGGRMGLRMVFWRNESFLCIFLSHKYICMHIYISQ